MTRPLVDAVERERIRTDLDHTFLVEAAAGTGKTTELVRRIVAVLARGFATVDSVVAVTFTEKAAGELKLRMRAGLETARRAATAGTPEHSNLENALARLEEARVGTIHGFCADLLRERSIEAEVDPLFVTMTEAESERFYGEAFQLWLQRKLEDPPEGVRRSLRRASNDGPIARLQQAGWTLAEWRDFPGAWRRDPWHRESRIDELIEEVHAFAALTERCLKKDKDNLYRDTERARRLSRETLLAEDARSRDYDGLEAALVELSSWKFARPRKGYGTSFGPGVSRQDVLGAHQKLTRALARFVEQADADLAALLHAELFETVELYAERKRRSGRVDFVDLLLRARDLVRDHASVRSDFQRRFTHLFVDEFQDTDPLQAEILLLLAADDARANEWRTSRATPGKLFLVADPKQSIYRFRRADVSIYLEVKERLESSGAVCLHLTTSFRAVPAIQSAVNSVFPSYMTGDAIAHQASYVALSASPERSDPSTQPTVVALPVPRPYGYRGGVTKAAIESSFPDAVGAFVHWVLDESGWTVTERESPGDRVPVSPRHICLLFRRFDSYFAGDVTRAYVQALEARGIRHLLVGGRSFHEREEVETIRTALVAIEWPDDELAVFATLRGALFAIDDEQLLQYRHQYRRLHPFRVPDDAPAAVAEVTTCLRELADLHRKRNSRPIAETIHLLLEATRAHAGFALRPSGEQALANVLHVAEQARTYESSGGISFRGYVERLLEDAKGRRAAEAPILEEGSEGVRIMTVHKAKGLEFPIVILADPTARIAGAKAHRWIDAERDLCAVRIGGWSPVELLEHADEEVARDIAEGVRVAYVAATRARDLLVIPALGDGPWGHGDPDELNAGSGWIAPLNRALYPEGVKWAKAREAPGCPRFGDDSVLDRPHDLAFGAESMRPGAHAVAESHDVVWWDPRALKLGVPPVFGIRQEELMSKDTEEAIVIADAHEFQNWEAEREKTIHGASAPALNVVTATRRAAVSDAPRGPVVHVELERDPARPAGARFGALVHAVLGALPLDAGSAELRRFVELEARILGATDTECEGARAAIEAAWAHPLLERARSAQARGDCRRETPVTLREDDGSLVDGIVDLAFREEGAWTVVDYKTDREVTDAFDAYERQVALYARGIALATGEPASAVLMRV